MPFRLGGSRTIRYLNRKSAKRRGGGARITGPWVLGVIALAMLVLMWALGALLFALSSHVSHQVQIKTSSSSLLKLTNGEGFPKQPLDLWPDDLSSPLLDHNLYSSCLPEDEPDKCKLPDEIDDKEASIAVVGTPGVFSSLIASFVSEFVELNGDGDEAAAVSVVVTHSLASALASPSVAYIIRPAILPPILETLDLILQTVKDGDTPQVSTLDILQILRLVLEWHCRMDVVAKDRAFLTLSLEDILSYPKVAEEALAEFLGYDAPGEDSTHVDTSPLAESALQRIDATSRLASHMPQERVDGVVQEHLDRIMSQSDNCLTAADPLEFSGSQGHHLSSRVLDLLEAFLAANPSTETVCRRYPLSVLCQNEAHGMEESD